VRPESFIFSPLPGSLTKRCVSPSIPFRYPRVPPVIVGTRRNRLFVTVVEL